MRIDLFTVIHKGIRAMLFDLARSAARADVGSNAAVDELDGHIDRVIAFLDEHAKLEHQFVLPEVRALDPLLADELAAEHRGLDVVQREVQLAPGCSEPLRILLNGGKLIFKDHFRLVQQPPDQRTFAIIHAPTRNKAQHFFALVLSQVRVNIFCNQVRLMSHGE